ncbi:hypothetical protein [Chitinimonas lacunae]|uniref:Uncharacterized protein n=1 Tax=Chitinimonas lacunae TaxID=1963018 RepID=A0ABV8MMA4_9NEIS
MKTEQTSSILELQNILKEVRAAEDSQDSDIEPLYEKLLEYLKCSENSREELVQVLTAAVCHFRNARSDGRGELSIDAIAYCMHELRWDEVLKVAIEEHRSYFVPRRSSTLIRLIEAFEDDWSEAEDYKRYANHDGA